MSDEFAVRLKAPPFLAQPGVVVPTRFPLPYFGLINASLVLIDVVTISF